tara:strand:+ start:286 stop:1044 length:759 start_codon:yes stop_codon:yes gene_type:complete
MKEKYIKIYGLQRTGTNYLEWSMNENFKNTNVLKHGNMLGWKHGNPVLIENVDWTGKNWDNQKHSDQELAQERVQNYQIELSKLGGKEPILQAAKENRIKYVFCVRDPYCWLTSRGPAWAGVLQDMPRDLEKAIHFWNEMNKKYFDFVTSVGSENCCFVTHFSLINNDKEMIQWIAEKFEIETNDTIHSRDDQINPGRWDSEFTEGKKIDKKKYGLPNWFLNNLNPSIVKRVSAAVDPGIMEFFEFEVWHLK